MNAYDEELPTRSFEYHTLALKIAKLSPQTKSTVGFIEKLQKIYDELYNKKYVSGQQEIITASAQFAIDLIRAEEDPETKRILLQMSEEIDELKNLSLDQRRNTRDQGKVISSMGIDLSEQTSLFKVRNNSLKISMLQGC